MSRQFLKSFLSGEKANYIVQFKVIDGAIKIFKAEQIYSIPQTIFIGHAETKADVKANDNVTEKELFESLNKFLNNN